MNHTITALALAATISCVPPAQAYTSSMHEYYRVLREANEVYGYAPRDRNHYLEDELQEQNDQLEQQNYNLQNLRQELRTLQYRNGTTCTRVRGQVPSASINC